MIVISIMFRNSPFVSLGTLAAISCLATAQAAEDDQDQAALIRQELQQMRKDYEARIKQMENRIAELERSKKSTATDPTTKPAAPAQQSIPAHTHKHVASDNGAKGGVMTTEPTIPEGFKFDKVTTGLTFNGYFRAGYGVNGAGDSMEAFKAPGAGSKYRLGNETETYIETAFSYNFPKLDLSPGTEFAIHFRPAYVINAGDQNYTTDLTIREAYGSAKGVWDAQPESEFWAGQRFYGQMDIHMTDFFYMDMSGYGGGVENIDVGIGKLSVAWLGGSVDSLNSNASADLNETNNKNSLDFRLSDIDLPGGKGLVWLALSHSDDLYKPNDNNVTIDASTGAAVGLGYRIPTICGGYSQTMLQYGVGSAANFRSTQADYSFLNLPDPGDPALMIDPDDAWHFRLTQDLVYQPNDRWGMQATFVWDEGDIGSAINSRNSWISGGLRGQYNINDYFSLALEAGMDHVDGFDTPSGNLYKFTLAPQITPARDIMSRPALRLFMTYAVWDDDLKGYIAPTSYGMDTDGLSFGMQVEAWW